MNVRRIWVMNGKKYSPEEKVATKERWKRKGHEKVSKKVKRRKGKGNEKQDIYRGRKKK